jgi:hypothetical protein
MSEPLLNPRNENWEVIAQKISTPTGATGTNRYLTLNAANGVKINTIAGPTGSTNPALFYNTTTKEITYSTLTAANVFNNIVYFGTTTVTVANKLYYFTTTSTWALASNSNSYGKLLGIAVGTSSTVDGMYVASNTGSIILTVSDADIGDTLFVSATAGLITGVQPSVITTVRQVGYKISTTEIKFELYPSLIGSNLATPTLSAATSTTGGFTFTITNYDALNSYTVSTTSGSVAPVTSSTVTQSGLSTGASATVSVTATRIGYLNSSTATVTGTAASYIVATGGTITNYTLGSINYKSHEFTSSGNFVVTSLGSSPIVDILIVAGGGGGGYDRGGGGGGGGFRTSTQTLGAASTFTVTVGTGGVPGNSGGGISSSGTNSSISGTGLTTIASTGGGRGAGIQAGVGAYYSASAGGSGGGGNPGSAPGAGNTGGYSPVEGYTGGTSSDGSQGAAGGGAGGPGGNNSGGAGGIGATNTYKTGSAITYANGAGGSGVSGGTARGAGGCGNAAAGIDGVVVIRYVVA